MRITIGGVRKTTKFKSVAEFESRYFPDSFERRIVEKGVNPHELGTRLARESLEKIRSQLSSDI